jgi:hypothetical protein
MKRFILKHDRQENLANIITEILKAELPDLFIGIGAKVLESGYTHGQALIAHLSSVVYHNRPIVLSYEYNESIMFVPNHN